MRNVLEWYEKGFFLTNGATSIKALAEWAEKTEMFISFSDTPLSSKTLEIYFAEVWDEMHPGKAADKHRKTTSKRKKE